MEFAPWPSFENDEIQAVIDVLKSGNVNQWTGQEVSSFEREFAQYIGVDYAIALANGSLALDIALKAFNIEEGDEVIVTPRSFVASASCVSLRGAVPVFVDVDPVSQNITLKSIAGSVNPKTKAIIAVNLAGWPCELDEIKTFCNKENLILIEDCAQAHGAEFNGKKIGSFGDCAIFSFCQDKIMTTGGEGGMLVTNNEELSHAVWSLKDHGKNKTQAFATNQSPGFKWLIDSLGTNCRMTEMQAAIGRVMLRKLDKWVKKRREYASLLDQGFENISGLRTTIPDKKFFHSYYKYYVFIKPDKLKKGWDRTRIIKSLNDQGIPCSTGICPEIYKEEVFKREPYKMSANKASSDLKVAKELGKTAIMFLVHPTLSIDSINYTIDQVKVIMREACS